MTFTGRMSLRFGSFPKWRLPGPRTFRLLRTRPYPEWVLIGLLLLLIALCILLYFVYVEPWINGGPEVRIGADSDRNRKAGPRAGQPIGSRRGCGRKGRAPMNWFPSRATFSVRSP